MSSAHITTVADKHMTNTRYTHRRRKHLKSGRARKAVILVRHQGPVTILEMEEKILYSRVHGREHGPRTR